MSGCGCGDGAKFDGLSTAYKRALWAVIAINATMFLVEMGAGLLSGSQALKADALDFLGDTATYGISLFVIGMPLVWRSRAALLKGLSLGAMGLWVLGSTAYQLLVLGLPRAEVMGAIGFLALAANSRPAYCCCSAIATATPMSGRSGCAAATMRSAMSPWSWQRVAFGRPPPHGPT